MKATKEEISLIKYMLKCNMIYFWYVPKQYENTIGTVEWKIFNNPNSITNTEVKKIINLLKKTPQKLTIHQKIEKITKITLQKLRDINPLKYSAINYNSLKEKSRKRENADARAYIYCMIMNTFTPEKISKTGFYEIIGDHFNRDRSTVIHGKNNVANVRGMSDIFEIIKKETEKHLDSIKLKNNESNLLLL